jgi:hypothetical protein
MDHDGQPWQAGLLGRFLGDGERTPVTALSADDALRDRLCVLQDRIENAMRARHGLPDRDAPREQA